MNFSLMVGLLSLVVWVIVGFVIPIGAGWIHLFLALGMTLLVRRVVTGSKAW